MSELRNAPQIEEADVSDEQLLPIAKEVVNTGVFAIKLATLKAWLLKSVFGLPEGGTTGQVLTKTADDDYAAGWADPQGGGGGGGIPEAPTDGKTYGRKNSAWAEVTAGGGGSGDGVFRARRYWRLGYFRTSSGAIGLQELTCYDKDGNVLPVSAISSRTSYGSGYAIGNIVDADKSNIWANDGSAIGEWVQLDMGASVPIARIALRARNDNNAATQTPWEFLLFAGEAVASMDFVGAPSIGNTAINQGATFGFNVPTVQISAGGGPITANKTNYPVLLASLASDNPGVGVAYSYQGGAFRTLPVKFTTDEAGTWDNATSVYTIPETGTYSVIGSLKLVDNTPALSYGIDIGVNLGDGPSFAWGNTSSNPNISNNRNSRQVVKTVKFNKGDKISLFMYADNGCDVNAAFLSIKRLVDTAVSDVTGSGTIGPNLRPTIIQTGSLRTKGNGTLSLPAAPTVGNVLIWISHSYAGGLAPSNLAKWARVLELGSDQNYALQTAQYQKAQIFMATVTADMTKDFAAVTGDVGNAMLLEVDRVDAIHANSWRIQVDANTGEGWVQVPKVAGDSIRVGFIEHDAVGAINFVTPNLKGTKFDFNGTYNHAGQAYILDKDDPSLLKIGVTGPTYPNHLWLNIVKFG